MKVLVEEIYDASVQIGHPYVTVVIIGKDDAEIARFTVAEEWTGTQIDVTWDGGGWANFER